MTTRQHWNPYAGEWQTVAVDVAPEPRRPALPRDQRQPARVCDLAGLSGGSPLDPGWRDTAFAPCDGFADMRTFVKPPAMRTHRAATVMPADPGRVTVTR